MGLFNKRSNSNNISIDKSEQELRDVLLQDTEEKEIVVTRSSVLEIPSVASGVNIISSLIASIPIKLYEFKENEVVEVKNDKRVNLLNLKAENTMSAYQMKEEFIKDYLLQGNSYIFVNKPDYKNEVESLHYVKEEYVSYMSNFDPVFKDMKILVNGKGYETSDFIILTRNSKDGIEGKGIIQSNNELLSTMLISMQREKKLATTGGVNRGIIKSAKKLSEQAMVALKRAWKNLYSGNNNAMVLNDGMDFVTVSQTSKDMELYNNKTANIKLIHELIGVPNSVIDGSASDSEFNNWVKVTINPILIQLEIAFNNSLLFEAEKGIKFFAFDTDEVLKSDIEKRYNSYEKGIKAGFLTLNEVRKWEQLRSIPNIGNLIRMSQGEVLFDPDKNEIFNTNSSTKTQLNEKGRQVIDEITV